MRNQAGRSWKIKLALYVIAGTASGAAAGALVSVPLWVAADPPPAWLMTSAAFFGCVLAIIGLTGRRVPLLQYDVATPQAWLHQGPVRWALKNGAALGFGASSRIGFALWYVVPVFAFFEGNPGAGAAVWGAYGLSRTIGAWPMMRLMRDPNALSRLDRLALAGRDTAIRSTSVALLSVSLAVLLGDALG